MRVSFDVDAAIRLAGSGLTPRDLAERFGVKATTIRVHLNRHGIAWPGRRIEKPHAVLVEVDAFLARHPKLSEADVGQQGCGDADVIQRLRSNGRGNRTLLRQLRSYMASVDGLAPAPAPVAKFRAAVVPPAYAPGPCPHCAVRADKHAEFGCRRRFP